ncbi:MAG TPA: hypothetical protein VEL47_02285 [Myxococcota bacterium]|nr:hypothetical protein [Myxococcota bacterium]
MDTIRVGSNIDAWCTRCKLVLAHTIEAVAGGKIKRVHCNTCHGHHQFKAHAPGEKKLSITAKLGTAPKTRSRVSDYARLLGSRDLSKAFGYDSSRHFAKGDVIRHTKFGLGVVVDEKDISKIEVLFESGPKILLRARSLS